MVPGVAGNQGQGYLAPPPNPSLHAQTQSGTGTRQAPHGAFTGPTQGKGGNAVKPLKSSAAGISRPGASRQQQQPHEDQQHAQAKTNKSRKPASGNYRPSSNSQQWVDPSVYLPYGYGSSDSSGPRRQQKVQPSLASGGYFDPVPSRYYPSGGYGQMSNAGYRQDNIPSSLFGNTASADEYSQFGGPYLSQAKSLTGKGYLSGRYPDMAAYDGSPSAVSSQYLQPTSGGEGAGGSYDFDGEYRSTQSYQDQEFYSPLSGQQGYKSQPSEQSPYKDKNSGFKSSAYKSQPGLYEGDHGFLLVFSIWSVKDIAQGYLLFCLPALDLYLLHLYCVFRFIPVNVCIFIFIVMLWSNCIFVIPLSCIFIFVVFLLLHLCPKCDSMLDVAEQYCDIIIFSGRPNLVISS